MSKRIGSHQRLPSSPVARSIITTVILLTVVPGISLVSIGFILTHHVYLYPSLEAKAKTTASTKQHDLGTSSHQSLKASPSITLSTQQALWSQEDTALFTIPGDDLELAHIGQNFPLTLVGDIANVNGKLWYHVQWSSPAGTSRGWVLATAVTFTSPGNVPANADFDALSPDLATYLGSFGSNAGAVVYDLTRQRYYTYNGNDQFITASSMKVPSC